MRWPPRCSSAPTMVAKKKTGSTKKSTSNKRTVKTPKAGMPRIAKAAKKAVKKIAKRVSKK
jgi:hypothetical protein